MSVADLFDSTQGLLSLQTIDRGLNGGIGRATPLGEGFLNFANGARSTSPEHLHNLELQPGQFGEFHRNNYPCLRCYYIDMFLASPTSSQRLSSLRLLFGIRLDTAEEKSWESAQ